jgi:hypothetical protein
MPVSLHISSIVPIAAFFSGVKGRDLAAKDSNGKSGLYRLGDVICCRPSCLLHPYISDPYVKVKIAGMKKKTQVIKQNLVRKIHISSTPVPHYLRAIVATESGVE